MDFGGRKAESLIYHHPELPKHPSLCSGSKTSYFLPISKLYLFHCPGYVDAGGLFPPAMSEFSSSYIQKRDMGGRDTQLAPGLKA